MEKEMEYYKQLAQNASLLKGLAEERRNAMAKFRDQKSSIMESNETCLEGLKQLGRPLPLFDVHTPDDDKE